MIYTVHCGIWVRDDAGSEKSSRYSKRRLTFLVRICCCPHPLLSLICLLPRVVLSQGLLRPSSKDVDLF